MPQDPNLYGQPAPKRQKKAMALSTSLSFASQLTSLLAQQKGDVVADTTTTRARPLKRSDKPDLCSTSSSAKKQKLGRGGGHHGEDEKDQRAAGQDRPDREPAKEKTMKKAASTAEVENKNDKNKLFIKDTSAAEDDLTKAERAHARRRMEAKARLYAAMQRGDYIAGEGASAIPGAGLVDFDRKWAEAQERRRKKKAGGGGNRDGQSSASSSSSGDDHSTDDNDDENGHDDNDNDNNDEDEQDTTLVEFEDEFGRLRRVTAAQARRFRRRAARGLASAVELEHMSARPRQPAQLIAGDAVQADAFLSQATALAGQDALNALEDVAAAAAALGGRDRPPTPPPQEHYRAEREVRTRGVGFYRFAADDEGARAGQMEGLARERDETERRRREKREEREGRAEGRRRALEARTREVRERKREVVERRARKMADSFLDGLGVEIGGGVADGERDKAAGGEEGAAGE